MRDFLCDVAAERAVLAGVLRNGFETYCDIADIVTPNTFSVESNQALWRVCQELMNTENVKQVDFPIIISTAKSLGLSDFFKSDSDIKHLRSIINTPVMPDNIRRMAGRIRKLEIAVLLEQQLESAKRNIRGLKGTETLNEIMSMAEQPIFDFTSLLTDAGASSGPQNIGLGAVEYVTHLMDNPRDMIGISTGMPRFDKAIGGGLRPNSLDIVVARMKVGKTQIVDNVGVHVTKNEGFPVLNIDTEMTREEHQLRIIANLADVYVEELETGKISLKSLGRKRVLEAAALLESLPYQYECVIGRQFEDILSSLRRWVTRTVGLNSEGKAKPCVVIYDYLKMMSSDFASGSLQEYQALGYVTTALKNFMGRYGVACLCFAQANRGGIDGEDTDVVGGSDRIAQYGTSLTMYKFKTDEERSEAGEKGHKYTHKLVPIVSRHGKGLDDGDYINVQAEYAKARLTEGPTRNELAKSGDVGDRSPKGFVVNDNNEQSEHVSF